MRDVIARGPSSLTLTEILFPLIFSIFLSDATAFVGRPKICLSEKISLSL